MLTDELASELDDDGLLFAQIREFRAVPDDVDDARLEADGERLDLVQRPLVGLVELARRVWLPVQRGLSAGRELAAGWKAQVEG